MATLTVIVGYCGSGKSWLLEQMRRNNPDASTLDEGAMVFPNGQPPHLYAEVAAALAGGTDAFVTLMECAHLAHRVLLDALVRAQAPGTRIAWWFFENNVSQANRNVCRDTARERDVKGNIEQNIRWAEGYEIPDGIQVMPMHVLPDRRSRRRLRVALAPAEPALRVLEVTWLKEGEEDVTYLAKAVPRADDLAALREHLRTLTGDEIELVDALAR